MDCVFCKIIKKELPSEIIYENRQFIAFKDIQPKAKMHILVVPKKHIQSISHLENKDKELIAGLILTARKIAKEKNLKGYKLLINVGREGGQIVDHLHLHLLAGFTEKKTKELP